MVKPLSIIVPVLSLCLLLVLLLPLVIKPEPGKAYLVSAASVSNTVVEASTASDAAAVANAADTAAAAPAADAAAADTAAVEAFEASVPQSGLVATGVETITYPGLSEFAAMMVNGAGTVDDVVGVYVNGILALPVRQQPAGQSDFVAAEPNMLTQFSMPKKFGAVGILAHNYLSGSRFPQLIQGTEIVLVYGGGQLKRFKITHTETYQALTPNSPFSNFINTDDPDRQIMTSAELFRHMYATSDRLIFQTCIEANGEASWGRLFIVAEPADSFQLSIPALQTLNDLN